MTHIEAMKQALELFEQFCRDSRLKYEHQAIYKTIVSLRQAIAEAEKQRNVTKEEHDVLIKAALRSATVVHDGLLTPKVNMLNTLAKDFPAEAEKQEPVAHWNFNQGFSHCMIDRLNEASKHNPAPVYTHPQPKREWVGLKEDDVNELCCTFMGQFNKVDFIKAVEAKLKKKNTQEPINWSDYESDGRIIKTYPKKDKT